MTPRTPQADSRTNVTSVRLNDAEYAAAATAADAEDVPIGVWMRQQINQASGYRPSKRRSRRAPSTDTSSPS